MHQPFHHQRQSLMTRASLPRSHPKHGVSINRSNLVFFHLLIHHHRFVPLCFLHHFLLSVSFSVFPLPGGLSCFLCSFFFQLFLATDLSLFPFIFFSLSFFVCPSLFVVHAATCRATELDAATRAHKFNEFTLEERNALRRCFNLLDLDHGGKVAFSLCHVLYELSIFLYPSLNLKLAVVLDHSRFGFLWD